ncbi:membrane protein of ER body-like protein isoform X3 [Glycine soja]|uniref:Membrane protein of ER body-like protein isoform B n=1 Tax=Glycine soja TaxID=3848 RepID=A0A445H7P4_GLYSO|nr:membrane protein of ER body-like protein isoform X3 [Glycine soja]RZB69710.1 Membrane protein of ER body-like protein isoform B [Glycine soja]
MEQEGHQWIVHPHDEEEGEEIMEDGALIRKQTVSHNKGNLIMEEVTFTSSSSSSSSSSNGSEHSNRICSVAPPNGSPVQKEEEVAERGDVGENCNHVNGDIVDYAAAGLAQVAEFAGAETNGEAITGVVVSQNKNSVYFDEQQDDEVNGVQNGDAFWSVHPTNLGERDFDVQADQSVVQNSLCSEITNQCMKTVDDKLPSVTEISHLHNSSDIQATAVTNFPEETSTKEAPNLIEEIDPQLEEFDVEAVLAKQETHDLFCPNCSSCITKRVILTKRKRNTKKSGSKPKRDKPENTHNLDNEAKCDELQTRGSSELPDSSAQPEAKQGVHANITPEPGILSPEPSADNNQPHEEPEVFRCLACLSFFIPSGKCFDRFRFDGANKSESARNLPSIPASNLQNPSIPQGSNANWLISLFPWKKGSKTSDAPLEYSGTGSAEQPNSTLTSNDEPSSPEIGHSKGPLADTSDIKNVKPTSNINHGHGGMNSLMSSTNDLSSIQSGTKGAGDLMNGVQSVVQDSIDFSAKKQLLAENWIISEGEKKNASVDIIRTDNAEVMSSGATTTETIVKAGQTTIEKPVEREPEFLASTTVGSQVIKESPKDGDKTPETVKNGYNSLGQGAQSPLQSSDSAILANDVASDKQNSGIDVILPSKPNIALLDNVKNEIEKGIHRPTGNENKGGDVILDVPAEDAIITEPRTLVQNGEQPRDEVGEPQGWEILKSIVYGGLIESITSLGIVSSAVSSGATPLNIIALGFANIIGGLFILGDNLIDLKKDNSGGDQTQTNVQDRYQESLGRKENFLLHAVVAVLSFLIFGAIPLVIYGLLINKNYYTEVKLATVAATSIVCIILLAIGKVYTSKAPKSYIKTVLYYVTLAISASGVSYIAGNLIKDFLEKLNQPESGFAITMPISDTSVGPAWMSY